MRGTPHADVVARGSSLRLGRLYNTRAAFFGGPVEVSEADERRESDAADRRVLQAAALMELFRRSQRREPDTADELRTWVSQNAVALPPDPAAILSGDQMSEALRDCVHRRRASRPTS